MSSMVALETRGPIKVDALPTMLNRLKNRNSWPREAVCQSTPPSPQVPTTLVSTVHVHPPTKPSGMWPPTHELWGFVDTGVHEVWRCGVLIYKGVA